MITRAEKVKAGIFLFGSVCLFAGFLVFLGYLELKKEGAEYFSFFEDVLSISQGAPVKFKGVQVGKITDVTILGTDKSRVRVTYRVERPELIMTNTRAQLGFLSPLSGEQYVNLEPDPAPDMGRLQPIGPGEEIPSRKSEITVTFGIIQDSLEKLNELLGGRDGEEGEGLAAMLRNFNSLLSENRENIKRILAEGGGALTRVNHLLGGAEGEQEFPARGLIGLTRQVQDALADVRPKLDVMVTRLTAATEAAERAFGRAETALGDVQDASSAVKKVAADLADTEFAERVSQSASEFSTLLQEFRKAIMAIADTSQSLAQASGRLDAMLQENRADFAAAVRSSRRVSEDLQSFAAAVRRNPSVLLRGKPAQKRDLSD